MRSSIAAWAILMMMAAASVAEEPSNLVISSDAAPMPRDELAAALFDDATFTAHLRTYFYDQTSNAVSDPAAAAIGGWLGYETGWIGDVLKFAAVGYTSQPLWAPEDRGGSLLLLDDQQGFSALGQAYAAFRIDGQTATVYRQLVDQSEINPHDSLMVPNTFEGITLQGAIGPVNYGGGVLSRMKTRDSFEFQNLGKAAGVSSTSLPLWFGGIDFAPARDVAITASVYAAPDLLASAYGEATWNTSLAENAELKLSGQFMYQGGLGDNLLNGCTCPTWVFGAKADLTVSGMTFTGGFTQTGRAADYKTPFGVWVGYTSMLVEDFDRAGEATLLAALSYDFATLGVDGLVASAQAAVDVYVPGGTDDWQEYDLSLNYDLTTFNQHWPLWLRAQYGYVDLGSGGHLNQFRLVLDYEVRLGGG